MVRPEWNDGHGGIGISYTPKDYKYVVIFMHGLGDSARGWDSLATLLQRRQDVFLKTRFVLPTADFRPITMNGRMPMPAWSDIYALSPDAKEDEEGLYESQARIWEIIDKEISGGIPSHNIVVGGFSQGAALAYLSALTYRERLGGVVALSGWLPLAPLGRNPETLATKPIEISPDNQSIPILHCHGTMDELVRLSFGRAAVTYLRDVKKMSCQFKEYPMAHSAVDEELIEVGDFIQAIFGKIESSSSTATTCDATTTGDDEN